MANKTDLDIRVLLDNAAGTLTNITAYLTSASIRGVQTLIEDTALSNEEQSFVAGKAGGTLPLSGMVNTTTDAIFGPHVGNRTSVRKEFEYQVFTTSTNSTGNVGQFLKGSALLANVEYSGALNSLEMFSADCTFDGAVTRTSQSTT